MNNQKPRLAVVGAGSMGSNHARTISRLQGAELGLIVDSDVDRAKKLASVYGCSYSNDVSNINTSTVDGVVVASPSHLHYKMTDSLLSSGFGVLVEKPISLETDEAEKLITKSANLGNVLMVGHIELFNPVVRELKKIIGDVAIKSMRFNRLGYVADTSRLYHDAVLDLMVHDVAIAQKLTNADDKNTTVVSSVGRSDTSFKPDPIESILTVTNPSSEKIIDIHLRASRAYTGGKVRQISVETENSVIEADLLTKVITQKVAGEGRFDVGGGTFVQDVKTAFCTPQENIEPLMMELQHFVDCLKGESTPDVESVSGKNGRSVLSVAKAILSQCIIVN